ncbi:hypothetical protein AXK12_02720 [Cephaloticoccus capnophilus]|uniref:PEP-CTERM protein-sorting domain-containing protein n=1 Tax=Cephaloticoccus capnophilus TaxID=1548208 RepID=A0A139SQR3_9BACT|nr:PEP-CTERM sorting domain-containing protein [Cephaloticoccus capnophilus]KXU36883.1 hypothetical protein AXK12_02720 [Cephaloticoccus capnophilus]
MCKISYDCVAESRRSRSRGRRLTWLLILAFSGLCLAAAKLAHAQLSPPERAYEWLDPTGTGDPTDAAAWLSPGGADLLPTDGAHLNFGTKPALADGYYKWVWDDDIGDWVEGPWVPGDYYVGEIAGLGESRLPARYASIWFGFGAPDEPLNMYTAYTLTGSEITVGYGTDEIDRLIAARGFGTHVFDLDVLIHEVPGLDFRIHNDMPSIFGDEELIFAQTLTSRSGTLIVSGLGRTTINALHGSGELIKEGAGLLYIDATNYLGELTLRGGTLIGEIADDSTLTLAGGVYGFEDGFRTFERDLGDGAAKVRWLVGKSGGFTALDGTELHVTLDGGRTLTWGEADFVSLGSELLFGSAEASGALHWHNALDLGDPSNRSARTIRLNRSSLGDFSLHLSEELIAAAGQTLRFIGSGTVVVSAGNDAFLGDLEIAGVDLVLGDGGRFGDAAHLTVSEGGTLAISIGASEASPLSGNAAITLSSGTLRWDDPHAANATRTLGDIILGGGANRIERSSAANHLRANSLTRIDPRSTLLVELIGPNRSGSLMEFTDTTALESSAIGGIHPWFVVTTGSSAGSSRSDWGIFDSDGHLKRYVTYYAGSEGTWTAGNNVNVTATTTLSDNRTINSLRLGSGVLLLEGHTLTIGSGGILVSNNRPATIYDGGNGSSFGAVTTAGGRPLYIHTHSALTLTAKITGGIDLVKTGAHSLHLNSANSGHSGHTNELGSIYIHQGELHLDGRSRLSSTGTITVGDGGSYAALVLDDHGAGTPILSGQRDLRLRGGHDYAKAPALILIGAHHDLRLNHLSISGNSVLEFRLPVTGGLSKIYSEVFTIDPTGRLFVRGWVQELAKSGTDYTGDRFTHILVSKTSPGLDDYLHQIWFEDYGPAKKTEWAEDNRYWEIVPGDFVRPLPEPSTYGAILAAAGIGLVAWRKRRARAAADTRLANGR